VLGDNIIENNVCNAVENFRKQKEGAKILLKEVTDASALVVAEIRGERVVGIQEKPKAPKSNFAVIGIYLYDASVLSENPSPQTLGTRRTRDYGSSIIFTSKKANLLTRSLMDGGTDAGTFESLLRANTLVAETGANKLTGKQSSTKQEMAR